MSKTETRKFFQPIPLSAILDPTYQSPFSKLEQFQLDMEISSSHHHHHHQNHLHTHHQLHRLQTESSFWSKLQATLISAMSNLVMSQPVFSSSLGHSMSLVPWKSYRCEVPTSELSTLNSSSSSPPPEKLDPENSSSLYHSVRSGLECLRYFATHSLQDEKLKLIQDCKQSPHHHLHHHLIAEPPLSTSHCASVVVVPPSPSSMVVVDSGSSCLHLPLSFLHTDSSLFCASAPCQGSATTSLFSLAMTGLLLATPQHMNLNVCYSSYFFSPVHVKGAARMFHSEPCVSKNSTSSQQYGGGAAEPTSIESEFEIFFHSASLPLGESMQTQCRRNQSTMAASATSKSSLSSSPSKGGILKHPPGTNGGNGCIRIETNWRSRNDDQHPFHSVSVCSASTSANGGKLTIACSSSVSGSPSRSMMGPACGGGGGGGVSRRFKTESESSTDSFIEFSASVESTDSFCIVFESAGGCIDEEDYADEQDWEDEDEDEEDSGDEDQVFNYSGNPSEDDSMDGAIFQTEMDDGDAVTKSSRGDDEMDCASSQPKKSNGKTVSFNEDNLVSVIEFEDDSESKDGRETYWEVFARDRARFQDRICRTGDILETILLPAHRLRIYNQRFDEQLQQQEAN